MPAISEIVDVIITRETRAISQAGFGTALILGTHKAFNSRLEYYASLDELALLFPSDTEVYKAASKYFGQNPSPERVAVGRRQVDDATINIDTVSNLVQYRITINGTDFNFTSDGSATAAEIRDGLIASINAGSEPVTAATGGPAAVDLTNDVPGDAWSLSVGARLSLAALATVDSIEDDLSATQAEQPDWYGLILTDRSSVSMQAAAGWVATQKKIFSASSEETDVVDVAENTDTTSLAAILHAASYDRTSCIFTENAEEDYPDAALLGRALPYQPGSYTLKFKTLEGVPVSSISTTQSTNARDKDCNVYEEIGGVNMVREGVVASGEFFDIIHGIDWLEARIAERIFAKLAASAKIPYTDAGVAVIENELRAQLQQGVDRGLLSSFTISVPRVASISNVDKANRLLPDVNFSAILAGAIHKVEVRGVVTV